jgi:hypothetical protein
VEKAREFLQENPDLCRELRQKILAAYGIESKETDQTAEKTKSQTDKTDSEKTAKK